MLQVLYRPGSIRGEKYSSQLEKNDSGVMFEAFSLAHEYAEMEEKGLV